MTTQPEKAEIVAALRDRVRTQLEALTESQQASQAGAAHAEARSEHPKDTRSTEASYLARGLADRVGQLQSAIIGLAEFAPPALPPAAPVALGALVGVEDEDGATTVHFLVPQGGGEKLPFSTGVIQALSPASPLGQALLGRRAEDEFEVDLPRGRVPCTISWVR
ncbi:MAG: GreA/GreB family elongation factor [Candidatus Binatia bacterium]|nr:GreA/GreB family elongation factor [Candidatus Binatia bacterium]